jgi:hypothetical protein
MTEPMASEPAEPTTRQDEVIEKAAEILHREQLEGGRSARGARALAEAGLLADPAQTTELEELRRDNRALEARIAEANENAGVDAYDIIKARKEANAALAERDALSLLLRGMARKLVAYRKWALKAHRDQDWVLNRVRAALGTPDGRAVSVHAAEVCAERDLALWLFAEARWYSERWLSTVAEAVRLLRNAGINRGNGLPARVATLIAERDERQASIDALAELDEDGEDWHGAVDAERVRAALVGDQPKAEEPKPRCCIGPFADGSHAPGCLDACQDCGGDEAGPRRCQCSDADPACTCTPSRCDYDGYPLDGPACLPCGQRPVGKPCLAIDEPLSGVALRDVEEADDAAGDLP